MSKRTTLRRQLNEAVMGCGFTMRGDAFFRVIGDGVLQVLKFEYEQGPQLYRLGLGLFSMYGELRKVWFTSSGCIPRYSIVNYIGERNFIKSWLEGNMLCSKPFSPEMQIDILKEFALRELNGILEQRQLLEEICRLEKVTFGRVLWNDLEKYAPCLKSGDLKKAENVILAILHQHGIDSYATEEEVKQLTEEDRHLVELLFLARNGDQNAIDHFLKCNKRQNEIYARFCISK